MQAVMPVLYTPVRTIRDQGISLRAWGSGTVSETDEQAYEGTNSIRVSTRNFFQGGVIVFTAPVSVGGAFSDKNNLLRLTYRVADDATITPGRGFGAPGSGGPSRGAGLAGAGGGGGAAAGGQSRGGGIPGGPPPGFQGGPPAGFRGGQEGPMGPGGSQTQTAMSTLKNLRLIVTTSDGKKSEVYVPVTTSAGGERGWKMVAVPLQSISGLSGTNKEVVSIGISGDATTTFFVGDLRVINDVTPISADVNVRELNLALGDEVVLASNGQAGSSVLKYSWDFDSSDGIQQDAEGQAIRRRFRKPGDFTVTLTVTDVYGLKRPYSTTIKVKVNP